MKNTWKVSLLVLIIIAFITSGYSSAQATMPVIKYQAETNYPPYKFVKNNYLSGFDVDLLNVILKSEDFQVEYSVDTWENVYNRLVNGEIDTCGLMVVLEERKKDILFSKTVLQSHISIYAKKDTQQIALDNIKNYKVGVGQGQYSETILRDTVGIKDYQSYPDIESALDALKQGEIDVLFENQEVTNYFIIKKDLQGEITPHSVNLFPVEIAYGVRKGNSGLVNYINRRISELQGSGVYEELFQKYFFRHSTYYHDLQKKKWVTFIFAILVFGLIAFILMHLYINRLKKRIENTNKELYRSYDELEAAHEELAATEEELRFQYNHIIENEESLKDSEERFRLALEGSNDIIWDMDIKNSKLFVSSRWTETLSFEEIEMPRDLKSWKDLIHPDDVENTLRMIRVHIMNKTPFYQDEHRLRTKDGKYKWFLHRGKAVWDVNGKPIRIAGSYTDISERKSTEEVIHQMAYYDSLTGLPNRTLLVDTLKNALTEAKAKKSMVSVMFLDLDNFKTINDTLGHTYGDLLLKNVGEMLGRYLKKGEMVARLGGDELVIIQPEIYSVEQVTSLASRIITSLEHPWILDDREFYVSSSIGIAIYPKDGQDEYTLLKNADIAMYHAKELGKNTYQLFNQSMNIKIMERLDMENSLRHALERNEYTVAYQPQIDIKTGKIVGAEALIRWVHPVWGTISPMKFIPIAEETGLIVPISEWMLRTACGQNKLWQQAGLPSIKMAVNLSARQFQQQGLVEMVARMLDDVGMNQQWLELEITETIAMQNLDYAIIILNKLQQMGIQVSLDDFGTGYSSLNYLRRLPINTLKIDKSFVRDITHSNCEQAIARSLISIAHSMDLEVVAEGVETEEQLFFLKRENCDKAQGYLFSKPIPAEELEELLRKQMIS
ncbi:EAL domain-containing protein [Petroclostridium sp. X23]|uniref:EAL domain-containing protein n=1 Tax=Petroclostridium sp. X23 TaxID=3045146 RepID=UPI0024ADAFE0|nr:EAL domain-containing protein [Petroclostridium sp. X23]WHH60305.1 EAL domain-containing protein [Petroclostridium sp. X23]